MLRLSACRQRTPAFAPTSTGCAPSWRTEKCVSKSRSAGSWIASAASRSVRKTLRPSTNSSSSLRATACSRAAQGARSRLPPRTAVLWCGRCPAQVRGMSLPPGLRPMCRRCRARQRPRADPRGPRPSAISAAARSFRCSLLHRRTWASPAPRGRCPPRPRPQHRRHRLSVRSGRRPCPGSRRLRCPRALVPRRTGARGACARRAVPSPRRREPPLRWQPQWPGVARSCGARPRRRERQQRLPPAPTPQLVVAVRGVLATCPRSTRRSCAPGRSLRRHAPGALRRSPGRAAAGRQAPMP
mmetsp:Transcript_54267/g.168506  ORF Transcript_54267/g.168506 Transcript_54267/m.168506 type:complete len:299 (-) Transcript_54267:56-952(-)